MSAGDAAKKRRLEEMFVAPMGGMLRTQAEMKEAYDAAVLTHPFVDMAEYRLEVSDNAVFSDGEGNVVGMLIRKGIPAKAAEMASDVLRTAASRTSLRASIFGGEPPLSGIAGYYDYSGSPVELKCRKTSFTCEVIQQWPNVFPLVEYVSSLYKAAAPVEWNAQNNAIPDIVRVNDSPFSTLTINQRFRTARHTDAGDFDAGHGVLAVLEGDFEGLHLGLTDFRVCFHMQPRDVLIFNTHHFHANTELEKHGKNLDWNRLTCVFYYRASLGEPNCLNHYRRRLDDAKQLPPAEREVELPEKIVAKDNGENLNRPAPVHAVFHTPFLAASSVVQSKTTFTRKMARVHQLLANRPNGPVGRGPCDSSAQTAFILAVFGEESMFSIIDGLYPRIDKVDQDLYVGVRNGPPLGGFSEASGAVDVASKNHTLLEEKTLKEALGGETELWKMWREAREKWLQLVKRDWDVMCERNPDREDFSWKNKSDMNTAFFDLCDVAKNVMLQLLGKENASKQEENAFWLCFAGHLYYSCENDLLMAKDAMSMKKLNVKLKDYNFGGTRYFVDMPKEEQERRMERKRRIEDARRNGNVVQRESESNCNWLENDAFDYQSERIVVAYEQQGWETPQANALRCVPGTAESHVELMRKAFTDATTKVRILVVVPSIQPGEEPDFLRIRQQSEYVRLSNNRAAQRSIAGQTPSMADISVSSGVWEPFDGVTVSFVSAEVFVNAPIPPTESYDLVVLRHCLCSSDAAGAARLVSHAVVQAPVMVSESVLSCRGEYRIAPTTLDEYDAVSPVAFQKLLNRWLPALPESHFEGIAHIQYLRAKKEIQSIMDASGATTGGVYHFPNSPRNTSVWVVSKS
ncbi:thymine dioxygenase, putative [Bodo saltans]|uniref:thymine dioxygenase n=1 Tax=Bodo saltans TaxID=75058 RepID=A0A0S4JFS0_BODSA|nr:thymine dioxygenase, putative [Bodo saltans]|eukprot:CUG87831.1 thymine dioxygenase, putative [Bodo saltans]